MCEAARIAFPRTRIIPAVRDEERRFLERFRGRRSERFVCLAKILGRHETTKKFQDYLVTCERMRSFRCGLLLVLLPVDSERLRPLPADATTVSVSVRSAYCSASCMESRTIPRAIVCVPMVGQICFLFLYCGNVDISRIIHPGILFLKEM